MILNMEISNRKTNEKTDFFVYNRNNAPPRVCARGGAEIFRNAINYFFSRSAYFSILENTMGAPSSRE